MSKPNILVTAAAGKTGAATTLALLDIGYPVRAFVRVQDDRSEVLRQAGAEIFVGDLADIEDLSNALKGIQRAYFCPTWNETQLYQASVFAVAAADSNLELIVQMSQWLSQPLHPSTSTRETYFTDKMLGWIPGVDQIIVNPGWFADNYMALLEPIAQLGIFPMPLGEGLAAPVSNEDMAKLIVVLITAPEKHIGKTYRPAGPILLNPQQIADIFATVLGRDVKYQNISDQLFLKAIGAMGLSSHMQSQLCYYVAEYRRGAFGIGVPNNVMEEIVGVPAEDFETIVQRYVKDSSLVRRSFTQKLMAMGNFAKLLLTPALNVDQYEKRQNHVRLKQPRFALESELWCHNHNIENAFGVNR